MIFRFGKATTYRRFRSTKKPLVGSGFSIGSVLTSGSLKEIDLQPTVLFQRFLFQHLQSWSVPERWLNCCSLICCCPCCNKPSLLLGTERLLSGPLWLQLPLSQPSRFCWKSRKMHLISYCSRRLFWPALALLCFRQQTDPLYSEPRQLGSLRRAVRFEPIG